jgi:hypothetical protein
MKSIYVIGSLRNALIPAFASELRTEGYEVFDDWHCAGPQADDFWQAYETSRGHSYDEALANHPAQNTFKLDKFHLDRCDAAVMYMPAGKSGHLELGYVIGKGKPGYILFDDLPEPDRYDVMYNFSTGVFFSRKKFLEALKAKL